MIAVNMREQPGTRKAILAEGQPQYTPLPVLLADDPSGMLAHVTEWALTDEERAAIAGGGAVRYTQLVPRGGCPACGPRLFHPVRLQVVPAQGRLPLEPVQ